MPDALTDFKGANLGWMNPFRGGVGGTVQTWTHVLRQMESGQDPQQVLSSAIAQMVDETINGTAAVRAAKTELDLVKDSTDTLPAFEAAVGALGPIPSATTIASDVWSTPLPTGIGGLAADLLEISSIAAYRLVNYATFRLYRSMDFLTCIQASQDGEPETEPPDLSESSSTARLPGESDLAFVARALPAYAWSANYIGSGLVGCFIEWPGRFVHSHYFYAPLPPTLAQIKALWNYVPTSGLPERNGIDDSMSIYALLPVEW